MRFLLLVTQLLGGLVGWVVRRGGWLFAAVGLGIVGGSFGIYVAAAACFGLWMALLVIDLMAIAAADGHDEIAAGTRGFVDRWPSIALSSGLGYALGVDEAIRRGLVDMPTPVSMFASVARGRVTNGALRSRGRFLLRALRGNDLLLSPLVLASRRTHDTVTLTVKPLSGQDWSDIAGSRTLIAAAYRCKSCSAIALADGLVDVVLSDRTEAEAEEISLLALLD